jgi:hypothetical protein
MTSVPGAQRTLAGPAADRRPNRDRQTRVAITVLGMHRSGTSAVARMLSLLGADLPSHVMPPWEANEPGHWEPEQIVALHDELLADASSGWDDVSRFPSAWYGSSSEETFRRRLVELLSEEYGSSRLFVLKDPRLCRLIPFWLRAAAEFGASPSFVIVVRNPLEVAASLKARDGFSFPKGLLLWLRHMIDVERDTRGQPRAFLSYDRLLGDWEREARSVSRQIGVPWPNLNDRTRVEIEAFLDRQHRHHEASKWDLEAHSAAVSWVSSAYQTLERAAAEGEGPSPETLDQVASVLDEADAAYGPLVAEAGLARKELDRREHEFVELREQLTNQVRERDRLTAELRARTWEGEQLRSQVAQLEAEVERTRAEIDAVRTETALTYLNASKAGKWRSARTLFSWVFPLPRKTGRRYVRTFFALRRSGSFDHGFYLTRYPDVAVAGENALMHYIEHGVADARDPNPEFSTHGYLSQHPELQESGENPLLHYLRSREAEPGPAVKG